MSRSEERALPSVWAIVLGYNHVEDTCECLRSLQSSAYARLTCLYVDNGSAPGTCETVLDAFPACRVLEVQPNAGVAGGFNAGIQHALEQGADYVVLLNNDTTVDAHVIENLVAAADPASGMVVPKIYYYDHPDTVWSAGSLFRRFPPVVYMRKTRGPDDGRFDELRDIDFATFCVIMLSRPMLERVGLLDPDYHFLYEDYDLCLRARTAGFRIRYAPRARVWHKISKTTGAGTPNPKFWHTYGRSESIFRRKFRYHRWLTGWTHTIYIVLRFLYEGNGYGLKPYVQGWCQGRRDELHPPPCLGDPQVARGQVRR